MPAVNCLYPSGNSYVIALEKLIPVIECCGDLMQPAVPLNATVLPSYDIERHVGKIRGSDISIGDIITVHGSDIEFLVTSKITYSRVYSIKSRHIGNTEWNEMPERKIAVSEIKKLFKVKKGEKTMLRKHGYDGNGNVVSLDGTCCGSEETKDAWKEFDKDNLKAGKDEVIARRKDHQLKAAAQKYDALSTRLAEVNCRLEVLTKEKTQLEEDLKIFE